MRPVKIELQYFGPYEHEVIDFDQFRAQSLFLVAGNTGAGKTTIFDAMCYALFGQTTNDHDRSAAALRSDFAPADRETKVTFTFTHQGTEYQVMRRPKQILRGRGDKLVTHNQAVSLIYPLNSATPHEITKIKEADQFITNLLNLTSDQFAQIVVLPQGKFRQFLDSDSNTKEKLLRDLFNTTLYEKWTIALKNQLSTMKKELADQQTKLQSVKENIPAIDAQLNSTDWLSAATALVTKLNAHQADLATREQAQQKTVTKLTNQLHNEQDLQKHREELAVVKKEAQQLQQRQKEIATLQHQLADLQWFQGQQAAYQRWQTGNTHLAELQAKINQLTDQQTQLTAQQRAATKQVQKLTTRQPAIADQQAQAQQLTAKLPLFQQVSELEKDVHRLTDKLATTRAAAKTEREQVTQANRELEELNTKLKEQANLATRRVELATKRAQYDRLVREQQAFNEVTADLQAEQTRQATLDAELTANRQAAQVRQQQLTELNDTYARHQIAVLATKLKPGTPCPVCGSTDHPLPAHLEDDGELVTDAQIHQATQELQAVQRAVSRYEEQQQQSTVQLSKLHQQRTTLMQTIGQLLACEELPPNWQELVTEQGQQLEQEQATIDRQAQAVTQWQAQQTQLQKQVASAQSTITQVEQTIQETKQELVKQQTLLTEKQAALPPTITDGKTAQAQIAAWQQQVADFNEHFKAAQEEQQQISEKLAINKNQLQQEQAADQQYQDAQTDLQATLTQALNDYRADLTWDFWQQAATQLVQLPALQTQLQEYTTQVHDNQQQQRRLTDLIQGRPAPDLAATQHQLQAATADLSQQQQELGRIRSQQQQVAETKQRVATIISKNTRLDQQLNQLQTLTDVVTGNTETHLPLERYILQSYFQDVLSAANVQLARLTNGRYQFELATESHGAGAKWSGLEVNVYDDNAGRTRSARTLSGGESFMAALALALALCQIIQEQSGGITIDALFIDEGFGSLDQQALEDALHALQELEGHRMIGIISHVTELEEQVPDQLLVESHNGRSRVLYKHEL